MIANFHNLLTGFSSVFEFFRDLFAMLPFVIQLLIYFGFGGFLFIAVMDMIRTR